MGRVDSLLPFSTCAASLPLGSEEADAYLANDDMQLRIEQLSEELAGLATKHYDANTKNGLELGDRIVFAKQQACVAAELVIDENLPTELRKGLFMHGGVRFPAAIRFSSWVPSDKSDFVAATRGFAVKVWLPDTFEPLPLHPLRGERKRKSARFFGMVLESVGNLVRNVRAPVQNYAYNKSTQYTNEESEDDFLAVHYDSPTQDFVLATSPRFVVSSVTALERWARVEWARFAGTLKRVIWRIVVDEGLFKLLELTQAFVLRQAVMSSGEGEINPLTSTYHSAAAFALGDLAVQYRVAPCLSETGTAIFDVIEDIEKRVGKDFLRDAVKRSTTTRKEPACMSLSVQIQRDACAQPIEQLHQEWTFPGRSKEPLSRVPGVHIDKDGYVQVAKFIIPQQHFGNGQNEVERTVSCKMLEFNVWNTLREHRPLGAMQHVRKQVYQQAAQARRIHGEEFRGGGDVQQYHLTSYPVPFQRLPKKIAHLPQADAFDLEKSTRLVAYNVPIFKEKARIIGAKSQLAALGDSLSSKFLSAQREGERPSLIKSRYGIYFGDNAFFDPPPSLHTWDSDQSFAGSFIAGAHSSVIEHCEGAVPPLFRNDKNTRSRIDAFLAEIGQQNLQELLDSRQLFCVDYQSLQPIIDAGHLRHRGGRVLYAPVVLLYVQRRMVYTSTPASHFRATLQKRRTMPQIEQMFLRQTQVPVKRQLMPLAVQLTRKTMLSQNRVFLPNEPNGYVWRFAKMHVSVADAHIHELVSHLALTHLVIEPIIVSFNRKLPSKHAVMLFMKPHFFQTLAINSLGRETLIAESEPIIDDILSLGLDGALALIMQETSKWRFWGASFKADMKRRGFWAPPSPDDAGTEIDDLPGFYFRDDAALLNAAINRYVSECIDSIYSSDKAVASDKLLQELFTELRDERFVALKGLGHILTVRRLKEFLSVLLWTATAQHAAVNFGQYEACAFVPARPLYLLKEMPSREAELRFVDEQFLLEALPSHADAMKVIRYGRTLSLPGLRTLLPLKMSTEHERSPAPLPDALDLAINKNDISECYREQYGRFIADLARIQYQIERRNLINNVSFTLLLPTNVPTSIEI
ncbi:MAG: hypothetical protein MHM6MM_005583 [Cercozoa sp. M6MM]